MLSPNARSRHRLLSACIYAYIHLELLGLCVCGVLPSALSVSSPVFDMHHAIMNSKSIPWVHKLTTSPQARFRERKAARTKITKVVWHYTGWLTLITWSCNCRWCLTFVAFWAPRVVSHFQKQHCVCLLPEASLKTFLIASESYSRLNLSSDLLRVALSFMLRI